MNNQQFLFEITFSIGFLLLLGFVNTSVAQNSTDTTHVFESEIIAFEKADKENPPPKDAILFVGSSSIRKWTSLKKDFSQKKVMNRGFGGSQFSDLLYYMDRIVFPYQPRQIFVYEGDNDTNAGVSPNQILHSFKAFVSRVKKQIPETEIVFISIKPSPSRASLINKMKRANTLIKAYAKHTNNVQYVDTFNPMLEKNGDIRTDIFSEDNLHMNAKGYDLWEKIIRPYLD